MRETKPRLAAINRLEFCTSTATLQERCRPRIRCSERAPHSRPGDGREEDRCSIVSARPAQATQRLQRVSFTFCGVTQSCVHNSTPGLSVQPKRTQRPDPGPHPTASPPAAALILRSFLSRAASLTVGHTQQLSSPPPPPPPLLLAIRPATRQLAAAVAAVRHSLPFASSSLVSSRLFPRAFTLLPLCSFSAGPAPSPPLCPPSPHHRIPSHTTIPVPDHVHGRICRTLLAADFDDSWLLLQVTDPGPPIP
jgi:hypothetical protein